MKPVKSEMAGTVLELKVKVGENVAVGQDMAILESMKMEVALTTPSAGKVEKIHKAVGDFVNEGETVFELN
jgi:acetyl-CoA carboxylase biotin carboxyl carrier protein